MIKLFQNANQGATAPMTGNLECRRNRRVESPFMALPNPARGHGFVRGSSEVALAAGSSERPSSTAESAIRLQPTSGSDLRGLVVSRLGPGMTWLARVVIPDLPHHMTRGGVRRMDVFFTAEHRLGFLKPLTYWAREARSEASDMRTVSTRPRDRSSVAGCSEGLMERDVTLRHEPIEGEGEEHIRRDTFDPESAHVLEAKPAVVVRMSDQATSGGVLRSQS